MRINESMIGGGRDDGESVRRTIFFFFPAEIYVYTKHCTSVCVCVCRAYKPLTLQHDVVLIYIYAFLRNVLKKFPKITDFRSSNITRKSPGQNSTRLSAKRSRVFASEISFLFFIFFPNRIRYTHTTVVHSS